MRQRIECQTVLDFQPSNLKLTNEYFKKYERVSEILDRAPEILDLAHDDLEEALAAVNDGGTDNKRGFKYTSDTVLRVVLCRKIEGMSFRQITVRIDDSHYLRRFVRIYDGPMLDFTTLNKLENAIRPETWKAINIALARTAVEAELISGESLRLDTTAVETNIHYPTDSSLLWDCYRVLARLVEQARDIDSDVVGSNRLQTRRVKRLHTKISRAANKKRQRRKKLKSLYKRLLGKVAAICAWSGSVVAGLKQGILRDEYSDGHTAAAEYIAAEMEHYTGLAVKVIDQTRRRVLEEEKVPNDEKLFSIFEPHTELLKRGKAGKEVEFGHMILIQQVAEKLITDYDVFEKRPAEPGLLASALDSHKRLFRKLPDELATDKGFYKNMKTINKLEKKIGTVSIAKKGKRTPEEVERELDPFFRHAQRFRAGVEGTISYLKRVFRLFRVMKKGWPRFVAEVGATIFTHNLLILARI